MQDDKEGAVSKAILQAWEEGCPVAAPNEELTKIALRRWNSSSRRKVDPADTDARIRDLSKGLIAKFELDPRLVDKP